MDVGTAVEGIVARATVHRIVAGAAGNQIVAGTAVEDVVASKAADEVTAAVAEDLILTGRPAQRVPPLPSMMRSPTTSVGAEATFSIVPPSSV